MKINKHRAVELWLQGNSFAEIGRQFGVTRQAVHKFFKTNYPDMASPKRKTADTGVDKPEDT